MSTRPATTVATLTTLPAFPDIPADVESLPAALQTAFIHGLVDHKLSTYPGASSRERRIGRLTGTGLNAKYPLREDQLKTLAEHYDHNNLSGRQAASLAVLRKYNPSFKAYLYFDSGIHPPEGSGDDVGNVDAQDVNWILSNRPNWLLRDRSGNPIRSAPGSIALAGEYWPNPGNSGFQRHFGAKLNKAIAATGQSWDGVLLDQFFGMTSSYVALAGTPPQTTYKTDAALQAAQLAFLTRVS